jgi:uncharacterized membrane protein HdeD (DUF308 family)
MNLLWLLLGPARSSRGPWLLAALGLLLATLGVAVGLDIQGMLSELLLEAIGYVLVALALFRLAFLAAGVGGGLLSRAGVRALVVLLIGFAVADFPDASDRLVPWLFGLALVIQGVYQAVSALVIRFPRWRLFVASGLVHVGAGAAMFRFWEQAMAWALPLLLGAALVVLGGSALHLAMRLSRFAGRAGDEDPAARVRYYLAFHLPPRFRRSDYPAPAAPATVGAPHGDLLVHVWTPLDVARADREANLVSRYIATRAADGTVVVGHAAMAMDPDVYVSHCDGDPNGYDDESEAWRELRSRDVAGEFLPSFEAEVEHYPLPSASFRFRNFREDQLRTFWAMYRQITAYNLTNRNCSVAVAAALEAAVMGSRGRSGRLRAMLGLLLDRDLWLAHFLRWKAREMVWTPGMMRDYAAVLQRLVEG